MQLALFQPLAVTTEGEPTRKARGPRRGERAQNERGKAGAELACMDLDEGVRAYTEAAHAHNTKRAYQND